MCGTSGGADLDFYELLTMLKSWSNSNITLSNSCLLCIACCHQQAGSRTAEGSHKRVCTVLWTVPYVFATAAEAKLQKLCHAVVALWLLVCCTGLRCGRLPTRCLQTGYIANLYTCGPP